MITIKDNAKCSGCTACANVCPKQCIKMQEDTEGFVYPKINAKQCVDCGSCNKVCPMEKTQIISQIPKVYALKNKKNLIRETSSSGGVFYELASEVIKENGIVFGCALNDKLKAEHIPVNNFDQLKRLKSSKYVQSDVKNTYYQTKKLLEKGEMVLYSGTPCQIAGLNSYLGKRYNKLLLVDVLCHGVPSPKLLREYIELIEKKYQSKAISINFRNKEKSWKRLYIDIHFENGQRYFKFCGYDRYMSMFLNNMSLRPSCYECPFASKKRQGDITLGDFWGISKLYPKYDDDKGVSLVLINNEKGKEFFERIKSSFVFFESDIETASSGQQTLTEPTYKNINRDKFYIAYEHEGLESALKKFVKIPSKQIQLYYDIMRIGLDIVRKIMKRGY